MVIVDKFSQVGHFAMLPTHFFASKGAEVFTTTICRIRRYPRSIISVRDTIFLSSFCGTLFELNGKKLHMSTAYLPQTDSQTNVVNCVLQQYLQAFVHDNPSQWEDFHTGQSCITTLRLILLLVFHLLISFMVVHHRPYQIIFWGLLLTSC